MFSDYKTVNLTEMQKIKHFLNFYVKIDKLRFLQISVSSELFRCDTFIPLKAFYQMTAIRKSRFLTDIIKIKISEKKKLFRFVKPHSFYILLAAHFVLLAEFFCKAGKA